MGNIVIVEGKNKYCFRNLEEIVKQFLGKDFYNLSKEEQDKKIRMKTVCAQDLADVFICHH